jgi:hypothetical protein
MRFSQRIPKAKAKYSIEKLSMVGALPKDTNIFSIKVDSLKSKVTLLQNHTISTLIEEKKSNYELPISELSQHFD